MAEKTVRINVVMKELNVGIQTLVEHLAKKGHVVEAKPMTKLTEEQYNLLLSDFQSDKKTKDDAKQLVNKKVEKKSEISTPSTRSRDAASDDDDEDDGILIKTELSPTSSVKPPPPP